MQDTIVSTKNVSKSFGSIEAVLDVSLEIERGKIFGLVGSDGAGKSTLLRMIATMIRPSQGEILIDGFDVVKQKQQVKPMFCP